MEVAATVTPSRHDTGSAVLDERWEPNPRGSAAGLDGDVVGTHQITVPLESTVRAAELAARGLWSPLTAGRAGGGGVALIHEPNLDAHQFGLVPQRLEQVGTTPLPQPLVLYPTTISAGDPPEVSDH
jgi:hypothetical protein